MPLARGDLDSNSISIVTLTATASTVSPPHLINAHSDNSINAPTPIPISISFTVSSSIISPTRPDQHQQQSQGQHRAAQHQHRHSITNSSSALTTTSTIHICLLSDYGARFRVSVLSSRAAFDPFFLPTVNSSQHSSFSTQHFGGTSLACSSDPDSLNADC